MANIVTQLEEKAKYMDRTVDKGIVNEETGSSIGIRENGDISIAASAEAQYKINKNNNSTVEVSFQSNTITNRKNIYADEIIVNNHKLNPALYELSDFKAMSNTAVGNFTMMGTVLVRAWEPHLKKYVLIRRLVRMPMFSNYLNTPDIPKDMKVNSDISDIINIANSGEVK